MTPSRPQCRLANVHPPCAHSKVPNFLGSDPRSCLPLAQFCGSPAPPYPLVRPTVGSFFDVRGGPHPRSGWSVGRCHRALSPTIEELSPSAGPSMSTAPVSSRPAYGVDNYFHWDHQDLSCSRVGVSQHHYSDEGQSAVESESGRHNQFSKFAVPWSTTAMCGDQPDELQTAAVTFQRSPLTTHWHFGGKHTRRETF